MKKFRKVIMLLAVAAVICLPGMAMADYTLQAGTNFYWSQPGSITFDQFDTYFSNGTTFSSAVIDGDVATIGWGGSFNGTDGWVGTKISDTLSRATGNDTSVLNWNYNFNGALPASYPLTFDINYYLDGRFVGHEGYQITAWNTYTPPNGFNQVEYNSNAVPEPATMLLLGFGLVGLAGARRKFKK